MKDAAERDEEDASACQSSFEAILVLIDIWLHSHVPPKTCNHDHEGKSCLDVNIDLLIRAV